MFGHYIIKFTSTAALFQVTEKPTEALVNTNALSVLR